MPKTKKDTIYRIVDAAVPVFLKDRGFSDEEIERLGYTPTGKKRHSQKQKANIK